MSSKTAKRVKNVLLTALRMLMFLALSLVIGINIYSWNAKKLMGESLPMPFGYGVAVVLSGSMEPTLSVDDIVIIRKSDDIGLNDVIVYEDGGSLIIHRVIAVDGDTLQTQGDANNTPDEKIDISDVKGELAFTLSGAGVITHLTRSPIIVIGIIVLVLVLLELAYKREKNAETEKIDQTKMSIRQLTDELQSGNGEIDVNKLKEVIERIENDLKNK